MVIVLPVYRMKSVVILFNFRDLYTVLENEINKKALLPWGYSLTEFVEVWLRNGLEGLCWLSVDRLPATNRKLVIERRLREVDAIAESMLYGMVKTPPELVDRPVRFKFTKSSLVLFYD